MRTVSKLCILLLIVLFPLFTQQQQSDGEQSSSGAEGAERPVVFTAEVSDAVTFSAVIKNEFWRVASGGINTDPHYLTNADLMMAADLSSLVGVEGTDIFVHVLANNGNSLSSSVGDVQMVSNIEAYQTVKLYQCWIQQSVPSVHLSFLFGIYDLNTEFYATPTSGLFLNGSHGIGIDLGQTGMNGPSIFPNTALAFRLHYSPAEDIQFSSAVIDGHPGAEDNCNAFDLTVSSRDGLFTIGEAVYQHQGNEKYGIGVWYFTGSYADVCGVDGLENYSERKDNAGIYFLADKKVFSEPDAEEQGLSLFSRFGFTNHHINNIQFHYGGGATYTGLFNGRDEDQFGYAVALASYGSDFRRLNQFLGNRVSSAETVHELTYRAPVAPWLALQFDVQYIVHPSASLQITNTFVAGFRCEVIL